MTQSTTTLIQLLDSFRADAKTQHEKGRHFENLALIYFRQDAKQQSCYRRVWTCGGWAFEYQLSVPAAFIDLTAELLSSNRVECAPRMVLCIESGIRRCRFQAAKPFVGCREFCRVG